MKETNIINIVVAWLYVIIGIIGLWAFYNYNHSALIICGILCAVQLLVATFTKQLQTYAIQYLWACVAFSYGVTQVLTLLVPYALCLYYATAIIYTLILLKIPQSIVITIVGIAGIIVYYLNVNQWFLVCGTFCLTSFVIACVRGKILGSAYRLWFGLFVIGWVGANSISLLPNLPNVERVITGFIWGSCAFYPVSAVYIWFRMRILKEDLTKPRSFD